MLLPLRRLKRRTRAFLCYSSASFTSWWGTTDKCLQQECLSILPQQSSAHLGIIFICLTGQELPGQFTPIVGGMCNSSFSWIDMRGCTMQQTHRQLLYERWIIGSWKLREERKKEIIYLYKKYKMSLFFFAYPLIDAAFHFRAWCHFTWCTINKINSQVSALFVSNERWNGPAISVGYLSVVTLFMAIDLKERWSASVLVRCFFRVAWLQWAPPQLINAA